MGKTPIESVNRFLQAGQGDKALEAFKKDVKSSLAYMFTGKPQFVQDGVISFFSKLVAIDEDFMSVIGPRRKTADGKFEHPTYHIAFDNRNGRFFTGFELKFVSNKYVKLVYPSPRDDYFDEQLGNLGYKVKHQSSGDYATVWISEETDEDAYESMAQAAYLVRCHYLGITPSKLKEVGKGGKSSEVSKRNYLPTKADCEMALKASQKSRKSSSIRKEDVFDWLEKHFQDRGISMKSNWKIITERNLDTWFG